MRVDTHGFRTACRLLLCGLLVLLGGCATAPLRGPDAALLAAQAEREAELSVRDHWRLTGRVAVSGEGDGGSGRIDWLQRGDVYIIELSAPVSRQSWRLSVDAAGARLEGLEQGPLLGSDAERLLHEATGWHLPLQLLRAWVRGARAQGPAELHFNEAGLPARLSQHGWEIDYRSWDDSASPALPVRIFAESEGRRVRLVVDRWQGGEESGVLDAP